MLNKESCKDGFKLCDAYEYSAATWQRLKGSQLGAETVYTAMFNLCRYDRKAVRVPAYVDFARVKKRGALAVELCLLNDDLEPFALQKNLVMHRGVLKAESGNPFYLADEAVKAAHLPTDSVVLEGVLMPYDYGTGLDRVASDLNIAFNSIKP